MQIAWKVCRIHLGKDLLGLTKRQPYIHGWMLLLEDRMDNREV